MAKKKKKGVTPTITKTFRIEVYRTPTRIFRILISDPLAIGANRVMTPEMWEEELNPPATQQFTDEEHDEFFEWLETQMEGDTTENVDNKIEIETAPESTEVVGFQRFDNWLPHHYHLLYGTGSSGLNKRARRNFIRAFETSGLAPDQGVFLTLPIASGVRDWKVASRRRDLMMRWLMNNLNGRGFWLIEFNTEGEYIGRMHIHVLLQGVVDGRPLMELPDAVKKKLDRHWRKLNPDLGNERLTRQATRLDTRGHLQYSLKDKSKTIPDDWHNYKRPTMWRGFGFGKDGAVKRKPDVSISPTDRSVVVTFKERLVEILVKSEAPGWYRSGIGKWKKVNMGLASRYEADLRSALVEAGVGEDDLARIWPGNKLHYHSPCELRT